jgi:hypothetical protein
MKTNFNMKLLLSAILALSCGAHSVHAKGKKGGSSKSSSAHTASHKGSMHKGSGHKAAALGVAKQKRMMVGDQKVGQFSVTGFDQELPSTKMALEGFKTHRVNRAIKRLNDRQALLQEVMGQANDDQKAQLKGWLSDVDNALTEWKALQQKVDDQLAKM